jgi:hypothetical protein
MDTVADLVVTDNPPDSVPSPAAVTARIFTTYAVEELKPLMVTGLVASAGESAVYAPYDEPPFVDKAYL